MKIDKFKNITVVNAAKGCFLIVNNIPNSEEVLGQPTEMVFTNNKELPNLSEKEITNN